MFGKSRKSSKNWEQVGGMVGYALEHYETAVFLLFSKQIICAPSKRSYFLQILLCFLTARSGHAISSDLTSLLIALLFIDSSSAFFWGLRTRVDR